MNSVTSMEITKQQEFQTTWMKEGLVLNLGHGIKKSKEKMMCAQYECKRTLLQKHDKKRINSWWRYIPKINVEQTKSNVGFYLYLYMLGI